MTWIYGYPLWFFAPAVVVAAVALAYLGLYFTYNFNPHRDRFTHNDVAGPIAGISGTVLAVMLSFMVVAVWQEYDAADANVQTEVSALYDLNHLASAFPSQTARRLRAEIQEYVDATVNREWPQMERGHNSELSSALLAHIQTDIVGYPAVTSSQQQVKAQAWQLSQTFVDARRERLFENEQGIPELMWVAMLFTGIVTIGMIYLFRVDSFRVHAIMTCGTAAIVAVIFVLIAEMDYPFRGDHGLAPTAYLRIQTALREPTEKARYY